MKKDFILIPRKLMWTMLKELDGEAFKRVLSALFAFALDGVEPDNLQSQKEITVYQRIKSRVR